MVKSQANKDGLSIIKCSIDKKKWTKNGDSKNRLDALVIVSKQKFIAYLKNTKEGKNKNIITDFLTIKEWRNVVEKGNFLKASLQSANCYINEKEKDGIKQINIDRFLEKFERDHWCIDRVTTRNWRDFQSGKLIDHDIYVAFCKALGIAEEDRKRFTFEPLIYKYALNETYLVDRLIRFNHQIQYKLFLEALSLRKKEAFLIEYKCIYRRNWVLRVLETKLQESLKLDFEYEEVNISNYLSDNSNFEINFNVDKIKKQLEKNHLIYVLDINTNNCTFDCLEKFLKNKWQPLIHEINQSGSKLSGKIILFLLSKNPSEDFTHKFKQSNFCQTITIETTPFDENELNLLLMEIRLKININIPSIDVNNLSIESQKGTDKFISKMYDICNIQTPALINAKWTNYP